MSKYYVLSDSIGIHVSFKLHEERRAMRPRVSWMNQTDDYILELLDESDLILSPSIIAVNLDYTRNWVSKRLAKLRDSGLVERVNEGYYQITENGRDYLAGDLDAEELERDEE